jgi:hypothetical protein
MTATTPALSAITGLGEMLAHPFIREAFLAGIPIAALAGIVGYFMVLRSQVFTGDALSHVAFTGALGALAFGIDPWLGLFAATIGIGIVLGLLGNRGRADDAVPDGPGGPRSGGPAPGPVPPVGGLVPCWHGRARAGCGRARRVWPHPATPLVGPYRARGRLETARTTRTATRDRAGRMAAAGGHASGDRWPGLGRAGARLGWLTPGAPGFRGGGDPWGLAASPGGVRPPHP